MTDLLISDKANIVVLDDQQQALLLLTEVLMTDYSVNLFLNRTAFITYVEQNQLIDLIIIEISALDGGNDIFNKLRSLSHIKNVPILLAISLNDKAQERLALSLDVSDYIIKPFSIPIELDRIEKKIYTSKMVQIIREQNHYFNKKAGTRTDLIDEIRSELMAITNDVTTREKETILLLARSADYRDPETGTHLKRMANYAKLIAKNLGLSEIQQDLILEAAPLHDIGKIGIPDDILLKPGKLSPQEFEIMKQHATISYEILQGSTSPLIMAAAEIALTHHEKFDGTGYPNGLQGEEIPLFGRIVAVADVFDALTSARPYKSPWPLQETADFLREQQGKHFDPVCVEAFLTDWSAVLDIYNNRYFQT